VQTNISLAFFSTPYVALDQKNPFVLEPEVSKDSNIIFLSGCMVQGNYNLRQWEQASNKKIFLLNAQHILVRLKFMPAAGLLQLRRTEIGGGTSRSYHSRL